MRLPALAEDVGDTLFRLFPHRVPTGLRAIGAPGRGSPVLLTGNYALTVRRLERVLAGRAAWLLVANSRGVNVWCAAGGGHLTHHDVISVIRTSGVGERVDGRRVVLPQLAATGVERRLVTEATGWSACWGPARLEDLPAFLDRGSRVRREERRMGFPLIRRLEMAAVWSPWLALPGAALVGLVGGWRAAGAGALVAPGACFPLYALLPRLRVTGRGRWLTYLGFAGAGAAAGAAALALLGAAAAANLLAVGAVSLASMLLLSLDLPGTTPVHPSSVGDQTEAARIELQQERCRGHADCVLVCPRDVLAMNGRRRQVAIARPQDCIRCGACIVQCPEDALRFRYDDGRVVGPDVVRSTRLNLLGRRGVRLGPADRRRT